MKRSTSRWTTAVAAAALLGLPAAGFAQTSPQQPSAATQTTAGSQGSDTATSAADHVREAKQALSSIPQSSIPASDKTKFAQLRTHLNNLERSVAANSAKSASAAKSPASSKWGTEVAAIDKILTDLIGPETGSAASSSSMTSGAAGSEAAPTGTSGSSASSARATTLDENAKTQLQVVRRHVTELAASMSGTASNSPSSAAATATPDATSAQPTGSSASATEPASASAQSAQSGESTQSAQSAVTSTQPPTGTPATADPTASQAQAPATAGQESQQPPAGAHVDAAAAKQALSDARDSLAQLAALPEAARLQGQTRTEVSQLISNFNELITTQTDWKAAYAKVEQSLNTLIGSEDAASSASAANPTAAGTAGTTGTGATSATGTSGTETGTAASSATPTAAGNNGASDLDPAIRAKLVDFRTHLKAFEQAAGGEQAASGEPQTAAAPSSSMSPAVSTSSASNPANPAAATTPESTSSAMQQTPTSAAQTPATAATSGAVGTSGSASATPAATDTQSAQAQEAAGHAQADKELDAIQTILSQAKNGKLDKTEVDQLKTHVQTLRQLLGQSK